MNRKHTLTALTFLIATTTAFAQSGEIDLQHFGAQESSTASRADVRRDVLKARASGDTLVPPQADVAGLFQKAPAASGVTRAQLRAEVLKARVDGTLERPRELDLNDTAIASTRSREDVRKEAVAATRSGQASRSVQAGH